MNLEAETILTQNFSFLNFVLQFSNFIFILFPPILIHLFKDYGYFINQGIHIIWVLLIIVGLSSAYFHATLSLIGQLLDEVAILWVCSAAFSMFSPKALFPKFLNGDRYTLSWCIGIMETGNVIFVFKLFF